MNACPKCRSVFSQVEFLRGHMRRAHNTDPRVAREFWPELTPQEIVRLSMWRYAMLEGWAFAMEEVSA